MTFYEDNSIKIYNSNCRDMSELADESIQCVVTSPPYWGLRKYKGNQDSIWGGREDCLHEWGDELKRNRGTLGNNLDSLVGSQTAGICKEANTQGTFCQLCGAWRGAYGLEPTPELYINHTVEIFREVRRVLRSDGVCFLNCGDSYAGSWGSMSHDLDGKAKRTGTNERPPQSYVGVQHVRQNGKHGKVLSSLKPYDFVSESPCDECVKIRSFRNSDKNGCHVQESHLSNVGSNLACRELKPDHQDSLHLTFPDGHNGADTSGLDYVPNLVDVQLHAVQESTNPESSGQLLDECLRKDDWFSSPDVLASLSRVFQECVYRKVCPFFSQTFAGVSLDSFESSCNIRGIVATDDSLVVRTLGKAYDVSAYPYYTIQSHLKAKDLCLIPQHLAIALQRDGWWVRSVIIWSKNNPMPESVKDRPTESHEYILLLTKSSKYYWDMEAVREKGFCTSSGSAQQDTSITHGMGCGNSGINKAKEKLKVELETNGFTTRNLRSVWTFSTQPYREAHSATFPEELPERCIKAGTPEYGCCDKCGTPYERELEITKDKRELRDGSNTKASITGNTTERRLGDNGWNLPSNESKTIGWQQVCKCQDSKPVPSMVLDCFAGSGTTLWVAKKLGRKAVGYELSEEYCQLIVERNRQQSLV